VGYYIETPTTHGKADYLTAHYDAQVVDRPASYAGIPEGKALIVVVSNGIFEAAGFAYSEREFDAFVNPSDQRPKTFLLMDRREAELASGYNREQGSMPDFSVRNPQEVRRAAKSADRQDAELHVAGTPEQSQSRLARFFSR